METIKIVSPYVQVFEKPTEDDSITDFEYIQYVPQDSSNMDKPGEQIIETKNLNDYLLPHKAMLEVRGKLVQTDGNDFPALTNITLVNNGWSLFKSIRYKIDGHEVEYVSDHLPIASTILNLVKFSDDYSRSTATNMFWYRDTGAGAADPNKHGVGGAALLPVATVANAANITGAQFRALDFANTLQIIWDSRAAVCLQRGIKPSPSR